jgi:3-hydroxyisobutyrate dehydrogenase
MTTIAFLGTGLLGSGFARAAKRRGETVSVWNRTVDRARPLEAEGIRVHLDPASAVSGADEVHLALSDDAAVDDVLAQAARGLSAGTLIVDHTTTSASGASARSLSFAERGFSFLHAPVFMGPQNALDATGLMLVSGAPELIARARPTLEKMTGKLVELGADPGRAAAFKLLGNLFLMAMSAGLADVFALGRALGVAPEEARTLFGHFNPGAFVPQRADRILQGAFDKPSWELAMARKDARLMLEAASQAGVELATLPGVAARMDAMIARGHGKDDWMVIALDALREDGQPRR